MTTTPPPRCSGGTGPGAGPYAGAGQGTGRFVEMTGYFADVFACSFHQQGRCVHADDDVAVTLVHETGTATDGAAFENRAPYTGLKAGLDVGPVIPTLRTPRRLIGPVVGNQG